MIDFFFFTAGVGVLVLCAAAGFCLVQYAERLRRETDRRFPLRGPLRRMPELRTHRTDGANGEEVRP